ncbi:camp-dependent protein kinase catalytic subunit 1 [Pavlovales sp. CCMP2436]|nr:camp-dependent protein kinase catalytic subunit 1 [Pavlovales sp. CCMP2436]
MVSADPIGEGGYGKVRLAQHRQTGSKYAIKQMSKTHLLRAQQTASAVGESRALNGVECRFITGKVGSFQTPHHLFLVLELAPGGDVYDLLGEKGGRFGLGDARALTAQLVMALDYLHTRSIVHRDVKLENLLLSADGTLKLTDFGFAKRIQYRTFTLCGTPEYLAPEIILNKGYNKGVDYWALGIVLFEMLAGDSPFVGADHMATYKNILHGKLRFPSSFPKEAAALVSRLLERDITKRFGLLKRGIKDIKAHSLFVGYDWDEVTGVSKKLVGPAPSYDGEWVSLSETRDVLQERELRPLSETEEACFLGF